MPGQLDASWVECGERLTVTITAEASMTILPGRLDQAASHGLLRRLYAQGWP